MCHPLYIFNFILYTNVLRLGQPPNEGERDCLVMKMVKLSENLDIRKKDVKRRNPMRVNKIFSNLNLT